MQKYELSQNNRHYILTTEVEGEYVKVTCVETGISNPPIFFGEFSLSYLKQLSAMFNTISTIYQAQEILNQTIETQKVTIEHQGNIINITLYITSESESEDSSAVKIGEMNNQYQGIQGQIFTQPIEYNTLENLKTETIYSQDQGFVGTNIAPVETTTTQTQEVYTTSNENYQNYQNYENYQNYYSSDLNINTDNQLQTIEESKSTNVQTLTLPLSTTETETNIEYQTTQTDNQDYNQYLTGYQYQTEAQTETQYEQQYIQPTITEVPYIPPTTEQPKIEYTSTQNEQIQYEIPNAQINYPTIEVNQIPGIQQQQKIVETTTTTTTEQYNHPAQPTQNIDMTFYNEKITQLQNETNRIRGEYDILKNEANKLSGEVSQLRSQITILLEENKVLRQRNGSMTNESQIQEITIIKQENESLRKQLEKYLSLENTFEQYKILKEQEINYFKLQLEEYIKNQKKLEEIILLKQKEIDELKYQIQQLINNVNITESRNYIMRQQQKSAADKQTLTIQDTHMERVKGDIIKTTAELEFLTRKICQNYKKVKLNLLYKATLDSDKAAVFHNKCDLANNSLVLVQSGNDKRFGGYTTCSWRGNSIEKKDDNAFVFSLDKMEIYDIIPGEDAIGCYPKYGPVFLGCQIRIYDEFFTKGGTTFEKGLNYNTQEDYELTGGLKVFDVKEIEVYGIELE